MHTYKITLHKWWNVRHLKVLFPVGIIKSDVKLYPNEFYFTTTLDRIEVKRLCYAIETIKEVN